MLFVNVRNPYMIKIELVYHSATGHWFKHKLSVQTGTTVAEVLNKSGIYEQHPETKHLDLGIFANKVSLQHILQHGDRLEIYRPLKLDPKDRRRRRAESMKV